MPDAIYFEDTIPPLQAFQQTLDTHNYQQIPENWFVVITDVVNSTKAIDAGKYRDINAVGGSTIAAVVNACKPRKIPYVFGGDGASFCVPPELIETVKSALRGCQQLAEHSSGLQLRVGVVPCNQLNNDVLVSRFYRTENLLQFFFMGGGLEEADALIKSKADFELAEDTPVKVDFSGFECRWNEIPSQKEVTFSLIVKSRHQDTNKTLRLYKKLATKMDRLLDAKNAKPLSVEGLSLSFNGPKLKMEASGHSFGKSLLKQWLRPIVIRLENVIGSVWMRFGMEYNGYNWGDYKHDLIDNSDFEKIDDAYRAVLSANKEQLNVLLLWLEKAYQRGVLFYGCHQTHSAIITCLVEQSGTHHIHFVDSADGGYAMAAKYLKQQIRQAQ